MISISRKGVSVYFRGWFRRTIVPHPRRKSFPAEFVNWINSPGGGLDAGTAVLYHGPGKVRANPPSQRSMLLSRHSMVRPQPISHSTKAPLRCCNVPAVSEWISRNITRKGCAGIRQTRIAGRDVSRRVFQFSCANPWSATRPRKLVIRQHQWIPAVDAWRGFPGVAHA